MSDPKPVEPATVAVSHDHPYPEVPNPEDLAVGVAAPAAEPSAPIERRQNGTFAGTDAARQAALRAAAARARNREQEARLANGLGLLSPSGRFVGGELPSNVTRAHVAEGDQWARAKGEEIARDVSCGLLSAGVASIIRSAAWQRTLSNALFELVCGGLFWERPVESYGPKEKPQPNLALIARASALADASRQNLLAAHHLAAKEAQSRLAQLGADDASWLTDGGTK